MASGFAIERVLGAVKKGEHISTKDIEEAITEYTVRTGKLRSDSKNYFDQGLLWKVLANSKRGQIKSAANQCGGAYKEYANLLEMTNHQNKSSSNRPSDQQKDRRDRPEGGTKIPAHDGRESQVGDSREKKTEERKVDKSRIDANDKGKNINFHMKNNPLIADLSDPNRPTKVAERYSELYDNEWTDAFEELKNDEEKNIRILLDIITEAYKFCKNRSDLQIKKMCAASKDILRTGAQKENYDDKTLEPVSEEDRMPLAQYRKLHAHMSVKKVTEDFLQSAKEKPGLFPGQSDNRALIQYARSCAEICWWMCIQDPPVFMSDVWPTSQARGPNQEMSFDQSTYRAYTKLGKTTKFIVWPCLFLYEEGPVLCKGVAQCV